MGRMQRRSLSPPRLLFSPALENRMPNQLPEFLPAANPFWLFRPYLSGKELGVEKLGSAVVMSYRFSSRFSVYSAQASAEIMCGFIEALPELKESFAQSPADPSQIFGSEENKDEGKDQHNFPSCEKSKCCSEHQHFSSSLASLIWRIDL